MRTLRTLTGIIALSAMLATSAFALGSTRSNHIGNTHHAGVTVTFEQLASRAAGQIRGNGHDYAHAGNHGNGDEGYHHGQAHHATYSPQNSRRR